MDQQTCQSTPCVLVLLVSVRPDRHDLQILAVSLDQRLSATQLLQFDHQDHAQHSAAEFVDQLNGSPDRSTSAEQIIHDPDFRAALECIDLHFQRVCSVLEDVVVADDVPRQFALLPNRDPADLQAVAHRSSKAKAARFDSDHGIWCVCRDVLDQCCVEHLHGRATCKKWTDVPEQDFRLGKVRNAPDQLCCIIKIHCLSVRVLISTFTHGTLRAVWVCGFFESYGNLLYTDVFVNF